MNDHRDSAVPEVNCTAVTPTVILADLDINESVEEGGSCGMKFATSFENKRKKDVVINGTGFLILFHLFLVSGVPMMMTGTQRIYYSDIEQQILVDIMGSNYTINCM